MPVRKTVGGLKVNVVSLFKTNTPKDYGKQTVYGKGKKSNNPKQYEKDIIRDIRTHFEQDDHYYKPIRVGSFWNNNYIEYEGNVYRNKNLSVKEYLNKIKPYLKYIIDLQKFDTWESLLTIAINFISSKNANEGQVMHSKSDNIEVVIYDNANEVIEKIFESLLSRYQIVIEASKKRSDFIFDGVNLLYYKCHKINFNVVDHI